MFVGRAVVVAHRHARLHRVGDQTVVDQFQRGDMGGGLERRVRGGLVFLDETPVVAQVVGQIVMHLGCAVLERRAFMSTTAGSSSMSSTIASAASRACSRFRPRRRRSDRRHGAPCPGPEPDGRVPASAWPCLSVTCQPQGRPPTPSKSSPVKMRTTPGIASAARGVDLVRCCHAPRPSAGNAHRPGRAVDVVGVIAVSGQKPDVLAPLRAGANAMILGHGVPPP